ncbi:MAG: DsbA family protein [Candidatus Brennerbacteria bacterium]|nr:DsbA family protein [Candidatus Brennerbacteria bacterium]
MDEEKIQQPNQQQKDYFLPASILVAGVLIAGSVIYSTGLKNTPIKPLQADLGIIATTPQIGDDVILGDKNAPITIVEFGDYQCPFCGRFFSETEARLRKEYIETGKAKMVYKDFAFLGPESDAAAQAAECAKDQGKYWVYHDALYNEEIADNQENNGNLTFDRLKEIAVENGLQKSQFDSCFDSKKYEAEVRGDYDEAQALGVKATPTIFINDQKFEGALPFSVFQEVIDKILAQQ